MEQKDVSIYEKKSYVNSRGFEIIQLCPIDKSKDTIFHGIAVAGMQTDEPGEIIPKRFQFEFPLEIKTIDEAFENFEKYLKNEVEQYIQEMERRELEAANAKKMSDGPIIVPTGANSMNFNPNYLKK